MSGYFTDEEVFCDLDSCVIAPCSTVATLDPIQMLFWNGENYSRIDYGMVLTNTPVFQ